MPSLSFISIIQQLTDNCFVERVDMFNKQKKAEKLHGMRSEQDLRRQIDEIERAAREAMETDRKDSLISAGGLGDRQVMLQA